MENTPDRILNSTMTQIEKYGGYEEYCAEMKRRRSLVKKPSGFAGMDKKRVRAAQLKSVEARRNAKNKLKEQNNIKSDN
jgi:hypothetical protein